MSKVIGPSDDVGEYFHEAMSVARYMFRGIKGNSAEPFRLMLPLLNADKLTGPVLADISGIHGNIMRHLAYYAATSGINPSDLTIPDFKIPVNRLMFHANTTLQRMCVCVCLWLLIDTLDCEYIRFSLYELDHNGTQQRVYTKDVDKLLKYFHNINADKVSHMFVLVEKA